MRISQEAQRVSIAQAEIGVALSRMWGEHDLTAVEMLQAVHAWESGVLKQMLRTERHPDNPDVGADIEVSGSVPDGEDGA